jgi:hypothetical protein
MPGSCASGRGRASWNWGGARYQHLALSKIVRQNILPSMQDANDFQAGCRRRIEDDVIADRKASQIRRQVWPAAAGFWIEGQHLHGVFERFSSAFAAVWLSMAM